MECTQGKEKKREKKKRKRTRKKRKGWGTINIVVRSHLPGKEHKLLSLSSSAFIDLALVFHLLLTQQPKRPFVTLFHPLSRSRSLTRASIIHQCSRHTQYALVHSFIHSHRQKEAESILLLLSLPPTQTHFLFFSRFSFALRYSFLLPSFLFLLLSVHSYTHSP